MNSDLVETIADAVLYEGYILYPYRPSAVKNQQRWNFGALCPPSYSVAQGGTESIHMRTECLLETGPETVLEVKIRFLHLLTREVGEIIADCRSPIAECGHLTVGPSDSHFRLVPEFNVNGKLLQTWQEAVERDVSLTPFRLHELYEPQRLPFSFPGSKEFEILRDEKDRRIVGVVVRTQQAVAGMVELRIANCELGNETDEESSEQYDSSQRALGDRQLFKLTVEITNTTTLAEAGQSSRDEALMRSLVSTHTILCVRGGEFVSLLDPPAAYREFASGCRNVGTYPVLVGDDGSRNCMLSSPIILYDYPQIAPESAGNLYDGTEIDEILTLRILSLTDEEKREMRGADDRARQILERTETLPMEQLMKMHSAMKGVNRK